MKTVFNKWLLTFVMVLISATQAHAQFGIRLETFGPLFEQINYRVTLNAFANRILGIDGSTFGMHLLTSAEYTGFSTDAESITRLAITSSARFEIGMGADTGGGAESFSTLLIGIQPIIRFGKRQYWDLYLDLTFGINVISSSPNVYAQWGAGAGFRVNIEPVFIDSKIAFRSGPNPIFLGKSTLAI
jgi:hypothetical protein